MNDTVEPSAYAYICVRARAAKAHGDALLASLPAPPDVVNHRGDARGENKRWKRTTVLYKTPNVPVHELEKAIADLVERLHEHSAAFRAIGAHAKLWLAIVVDPVVGRWRIRLSAHAIALLAVIDARVWFDVFSQAPPGTEHGPVCAYCRIERPAPDEEPVADLLNGWGPHHGIADARLAVSGLYEDAARPLIDDWKFLYAPLDDLGVVMLAGRPWATNAKRDGAVAAGVLLKRLRAARGVWRALKSSDVRFVEVRVQHWVNARRAGAWLPRRDLRRMAKLWAAFSYQVIADPKPSFREDGQCNHCAYVQAWSTTDKHEST